MVSHVSTMLLWVICGSPMSLLYIIMILIHIGVQGSLMHIGVRQPDPYWVRHQPDPATVTEGSILGVSAGLVQRG